MLTRGALMDRPQSPLPDTDNPSINSLYWKRRSRLSNLFMVLHIADVVKRKRTAYAIYETRLKNTTRLFIWVY